MTSLLDGSVAAARASWWSRGRRDLAEDPERAVGWFLAVGLAGVVAWVSASSLSTPVPPGVSAAEAGNAYERIVAWPDSAVRLAGVLDPWLPTFALAGSVLAVSAVLLARRRPLVATASAGLPIAVTTVVLGTYLWSWWLALGAVAVVGALRHPLRAVVPLAASVGVMAIWFAPTFDVVYPGVLGTNSGPGAWKVVVGHSAYVVVATAASASLGVWLRSRAGAREAERARERAVEVETRSAERARLARDLHDVVAHHVSLVAVRAESAPFTHPGLDDAARAVLAEIAADARSALAELRGVLAVLQRSEAIELAPQPGAGDIDRLVDDARSAGQQVEVSGAWDAPPAPVGHVLYRCAQEALTNARRHAPGEPVLLEREQPDGSAVLRVSNRVRGVAGGPVVPGRGLIGMAERVESVGGSLVAAVADGRYRLVVSLPVGTDA